MKTPKTRKSQGERMDVEKSSGKKLVQARLPFKIISTPPTPSEGVAETKGGDKESKEVRKRKLSYDKEETDTVKTLQPSTKRRSLKNDANVSLKKKQKKEVKKTNVSEVVELTDSNDEETSEIKNSGHKENLRKIESKQKQTEIAVDKDVCNDDAELVESSENETPEPAKIQSKKICTPVSSKINTPTTSTNKKTTNTPQSGKKTTVSKGRKSNGDATTENSKVQIKLPINTKKSKRRKTSLQAAEANEEPELSDDVEVISENLHPQKRPKLDEDEVEISTKGTAKLISKEVPKVDEKQQQQEEVKDEEEEDTVPKVNKSVTNSNTETLNSNKKQTELNKSPKNPKTKQKGEGSDREETSESDLNISKSQNGSNTVTDVEDNIDTEATVTETKKLDKPKKDDDNNKLSSPKGTNETKNLKGSKNSLTPKQQKLIEQRLKAREEKERKIQEERLQKQREKEDRELSKKREREEKEEKRRKEREEKEEQRKKEKEEKELKRLAESEAKNEEKRNKEEERKRKEQEKEDERKRKEQEKEEAELKKKKAALAFTKFFSRPAPDATGQSAKEHDESLESNEALAFRPFQIKGDMKLAPVVRKKLNTDERNRLDIIAEKKEELKITKLYLEQLKMGNVRPCKWIPSAVSENVEIKPAERDGNDDDDDVIIIDDDLERVGQAIGEEHSEPVERLRSKLYKFHGNRRPPYFGTWRKKSSIITARRPFAQDKKFFDYEVDSDEEWEEEEPGESLDGSDDDKEKESEDEDYEVDNEWFVPHGHLSDEELQNEDDLGENNDREAQKAKLQILQQKFAQEMKKKTEKIKPRLIGCIWVDENGNQPELCPKIIWDTLNMRTILCAEPPIMEEPETLVDKNIEGNVGNGEKSNGDNKLKPIVLTEEMLKKLIRLVHGNRNSKNFLIREFIAYVEANEDSIKNGDKRGPLKSVVREKIQEYAKWEIINANNEDNITNSSKKKNKKKLCWVVSGQTLEKMNMEDLDLKNDWEYILQPRENTITPTTKVDTPNSTLVNSDDSNEQSETNTNIEQSGVTSQTTQIKNKNTSDIKKFTKILTPAEKAQQLQKQAELMKTPTSKTTTTNISSVKTTPNDKPAKTDKQSNANPTVKKRVPLLMSVARGQAISTTDKNARISEFLKSMNDKKTTDQQNKNNNTNTTKPMKIIATVEID